MKIWCSNYRNKQYSLVSTHILIIIPSYDVHRVHESPSDGMDHQWSQNTILIDRIKMTFLYIICHNMVNESVTCSFSMKIWCSNYRNMQYWLSSNHVVIIIPSYNVHHVHESQSDGMDHRWSQNIILIDIIKMTFLYIIFHNIYYCDLSPWCILWYGNATTSVIPKKPYFLSY